MSNYQIIREQIKPGDILLSRDKNSTISTIISGVTHSNWSHSFLYIGDNKIIDSIWKGTKLRKLDKYFTGEYSLGLFRVTPELTEEQVAKVVKQARKYIGIDYGGLQLLWQGILRLCGKNEDPDWGVDVTPGMICSEMIARCYQKIGVRFKDLPPHQMEPLDFDESSITVRIA